jgi:hypothetical protein
MTDGKGRNPRNVRRAGLLFSGLLVTLTLPLPGLAEDASGSGSGPLGFPSGSTLRSIVAGEAAPGKSLPGKPLRPDFGPREWSQEGGGQTRNPFFASRTGRKTPFPPPPLSAPPSPGEGSLLFSAPQKTNSAVEWERNFGTTPLVALDYHFAHQPVLAGGRLLLSSTRGQVLCLDAVTGTTLWHVRLPESVWTSGVADQNAFYVASGSPNVTAPHMMGYAQTRKIRRGAGTGHLYALSLLSGKILWTAPVPGPVLGSPVLADGKIWVATGNARLAGYSVVRERKVIDMPLRSSAGWSSPLYVHHWLWLSLEGPTKLVALWPEKKRTVWALTTPPTERLVLFTPTPAFGAMRLVTLFLSVDRGLPRERLATASAVTGHIFHEFPFAARKERVNVAPVEPPDLPSFARVYEGESGPVVAGQTAVAASPILARALAVDIPSGHPFWSVALPARPESSGTVAGLLYLLPLRDRLLLLDLATGKILKMRSLDGEPAPGSPPVMETTLYLAEKNGRVRAISLEKERTRIFPPPAPPSLSSGRPEGERPPDRSGEGR